MFFSRFKCGAYFRSAVIKKMNAIKKSFILILRYILSVRNILKYLTEAFFDLSPFVSLALFKCFTSGFFTQLHSQCLFLQRHFDEKKLPMLF